MKFFIDTANLAQIKEAQDLGVLDGVTTNPSLMAKEGISGEENVINHYKAICEIVDGDVSAEVISTDYEGMIKEGEALAALDSKIVVKVPMIKDGVKAIKYFSKKGIKTNCTLVFSAGQALLAAKAGATYVSPFIGRLDDISVDGLGLIEEIREIYDNYGFETQILAASVRHSAHILGCAKIGADVMTGPLSAITALLKHPLTDSGLAQFLADHAKAAEVEAEANAISDVISQEEISKRQDFRNTTTFTIDPADAKDFDDAISFKKLENGNYEVGVHIADVSHYVIPDSQLDKEAFERGTSVYLVDRVIPMLPERLSNNLCSLRPNEDKLCFSAVFELDERANVLDQWFGRTVIHSDRRFSYEEAQEIIEGKEDELSEPILKLNELAYILRERKFKSGAISFETEEVKFLLDDNGKPLGVYTKVRKDAHKLIEDFMLLANRKVAEYIGKQGKGKSKLTFVYRFHDVPNTETLTSFSQFASRFGHRLSFKSDKETAKSLNMMMEQIEGSKEQNLLTSLAIRSMAKAIYTTKKASHYGLAFDYYTHFTSPIRRYPDVMVHRLLQYYLDGGKKVNTEHYEKMSEHSSQMEKKAAEAERASVKYKQAEYLQNQIGTEYTGIISGVTEWGMYVEIEENKCEGMVRLRDITDDFYTLDEKNYAIIGQRKKKVYQLGDEVQIKVKKVDLDKRQIDFTLIS
ncbi:UNVERIFIED_CONTAM: rnr [Trichonephila clavipes]